MYRQKMRFANTIAMLLTHHATQTLHAQIEGYPSLTPCEGCSLCLGMLDLAGAIYMVTQLLP